MSGGDGIGPPGSDPDLRAAEYVLGTLTGPERDALEREAAADARMASRIQAWERRLAPLLHAMPPIAPPERVRAALLRALPVSDEARSDQLALLRRQVRRWRVAAAGAGLLAAGLALFVAVGSWPGQAGGRYLAVVQGGGALPALLVRVDTRAGTARVRRVGAEAPAGQSLELWYVGAAGPRALGLVGAAPGQVRLPQDVSPDGVIAVSVEPPGGSPSGQPTGPVVYTGKLIAE